MVIVMRDKYPDGKDGTMSPRKGKMIAQGCHAACHFLIEIIDRMRLQGTNAVVWSEAERTWLETGTKKICVRADSEEHLLDIYRRAQEAKLTVHLVTDSGLTEFNGPTKTCLAIGPNFSTQIDKITGELKLL